MATGASFNSAVGIHPDDSPKFLSAPEAGHSRHFELADELEPTAIWIVTTTGKRRENLELVTIENARKRVLTADFEHQLCRLEPPDSGQLSAIEFLLRPVGADLTFTLEIRDQHEQTFYVRFDQDDKRLRLRPEPDQQTRFSVAEGPQRHPADEDFLGPLIDGIFDQLIAAGLMQRTPAQTPAQRQAMIERFAPRIYFHPDERYLSSSIDFYTQQVWLMKDGKVDHSRHPSFTDLALVSGDSREENKSLKLYAPADAALRAGQEPSTNPPCYAQLLEFPLYTEIQYWFFYPYNGRPKSSKTPGTHEGDWEHVTVRIDPRTNRVLEILGSAHADEDTWYSPDELERVFDDHFVLYTALETHAIYATTGTQTRKLGICPPDYTDKSSKVWDCWKHVIEVKWSAELPTLNRQDWIKFTGRWGQTKSVAGSSPTNISVKDAFKDGEPGSKLGLRFSG